MPMQAAVQHLVLEKLDSCFDKGGDCTVVVVCKMPCPEVDHLDEVDVAGKRYKVERRYQVWSMLLRQWSDVFDAKIQRWNSSDALEIRIGDASPQAVEALLRFMYSGQLHCKPASYPEVTRLASMYMMPELKHHCCAALQQQTDVDEELQGNIRKSHLTARELFVEGIQPSQLRKLGFTFNELHLAGFSPAELLGSGFSTQELADGVWEIGITQAISFFSQVDPMSAAHILGMLASEKAARILGSEEMKTSKAASIFMKMDSGEAGHLLGAGMEVTRAAKILQRLETELAASAILGVDEVKASEIVQKLRSADAAKILFQGSCYAKIPITKAVDIINLMPNGFVARILTRLPAGQESQAADILRNMGYGKAAIILAEKEVHASVAARILHSMHYNEQASIMGADEMDSKKVASILEPKSAIEDWNFKRAAYIIDSLSSKKAINILNHIPSMAHRARILGCGEIKIEKAAQILHYVPLSSVAAILNADEMSAAVAERIICTMAPDRVAQIFRTAELHAKKAALILRDKDHEHIASILVQLEVWKAARILDEIHIDESTSILNSVEMGAGREAMIRACLRPKVGQRVCALKSSPGMGSIREGEKYKQFDKGNIVDTGRSVRGKNAVWIIWEESGERTEISVENFHKHYISCT